MNPDRHAVNPIDTPDRGRLGRDPATHSPTTAVAEYVGEEVRDLREIESIVAEYESLIASASAAVSRPVEPPPGLVARNVAEAPLTDPEYRRQRARGHRVDLPLSHRSRPTSTAKVDHHQPGPGIDATIDGTPARVTQFFPYR